MTSPKRDRNVVRIFGLLWIMETNFIKSCQPRSQGLFPGFGAPRRQAMEKTLGTRLKTCTLEAEIFGEWLNLVQARGGGGVLNKSLYGEAPPRGPTPYPFCTILAEKVPLFIYLLLKKGTPFTHLF